MHLNVTSSPLWFTSWWSSAFVFKHSETRVLLSFVLLHEMAVLLFKLFIIFPKNTDTQCTIYVWSTCSVASGKTRGKHLVKPGMSTVYIPFTINASISCAKGTKIDVCMWAQTCFVSQDMCARSTNTVTSPWYWHTQSDAHRNTRVPAISADVCICSHRAWLGQSHCGRQSGCAPMHDSEIYTFITYTYTQTYSEMQTRHKPQSNSQQTLLFMSDKFMQTHLKDQDNEKRWIAVMQTTTHYDWFGDEKFIWC